ncbi:MAG TPA: YwiC-like family protein, partial [Candidatus Angelobacter sp.]|nr:YwiC-like family protein [Candidatus Angelobacter sp.]
MPAAKPRLLQFPASAPPARQFIVPREHGAWALWLFPLISGGIVGYAAAPRTIAPALWFSLLALTAFLIRQPLDSLLGSSVLKIRSPQEYRIALFWVMGLTAIAAFCAFELVGLKRALVLGFGLAALACFALSAAFSKSRRLRIARQLVGALGLSSTSAGAYYVVTGQITRTALLLWLLNWLFAIGQIEYVQLRLHTARVASTRAKAEAGWKIALF